MNRLTELISYMIISNLLSGMNPNNISSNHYHTDCALELKLNISKNILRIKDCRNSKGGCTAIFEVIKT